MSGEKTKLVYSTEQAVPRKDAPAKPSPAINAPVSKQQVYVRLDRKGRGGKSVSVISGLCLSHKDMEALLKKLKARLGTGGTIKDDDLEIQGDHRDVICAMLQDLGHNPKRSGG